MVESESRPSDEARGSSKSSTTSTAESREMVDPLAALVGGEGRGCDTRRFGVASSSGVFTPSPTADSISSAAGVEEALPGWLARFASSAAASSSSSSKTSGIDPVGVSLAVLNSNGTSSGALSVLRWFMDDWKPKECIDRLGRGCDFAGEPRELAPNGGVLKGPKAASRSITGLKGSESA